MKKLFLLLILVPLLNGCAVFKLGDIPQAKLVPIPPGTSKPTVSYTLRATSHIFSKNELAPPMQKKMNEELLKTLQETHCFRQVSPYNCNADLKLSVEMMEQADPAGMIGAVITGYSFGIIPSWSTAHYRLIVTANNTGVSKTYQVRDRARMFMWLPMVFVFPFHDLSTINDVQQNMYKTAVQQMQADGLLVKKEAPVPVPAKEVPTTGTTAVESAEVGPTS